MADIRASLAEFGADPSALRLLDDERPELLPYATLMTARRNRHATLGIVEAVYEWQGTPLVFLIDADSLEDDGQLQRIRRLLAMRGDAPYLGVVAPGSLRVYRIALDRKSLRQARVGWEGRRRCEVYGVLAAGQRASPSRNHEQGLDFQCRPETVERFDDEAYRTRGLAHEDAISLVGRALFTRFLADRSLLPEGMSEPRDGGEPFRRTREVAEETSNWLDTTFNGDLLPLSAGIFERLPAQGYGVLGDVLRRAPDRAAVSRLGGEVGQPGLRPHPRRCPESGVRTLPEEARAG